MITSNASVKWHVNDVTLTTGRCGAKYQCPFGDIDTEHYATEGEAVAALDKLQKEKGKNLPPAVSDEIKEMDADGLAHDLLNRVDEFAENPEEYSDILELTSVLHAHQKRRNRMHHETTPYIEHTLRASLRLIKAGVRDENVIRAAMLHDSLEDGSQVFVSSFTDGKSDNENQAREVLNSYITQKHGKETARLVRAVTNPVSPPPDQKPTAEEKNRKYFEHVRAAITDDNAVTLIKLSDFIDNAGSLHHTDVPGKEATSLKQAVKYLPCVGLFRDELRKGNDLLPDDSIDRFISQLNRTESRIRNIIEKYSDLK